MPLVRGHYPTFNPEWALDGSPTGTLRANMPRRSIAGNLSALTTQVMLSTALYLEAGDVVTNLTFVSGGTGAGTPTNWWFALYSNAATPALLAQTADQTSTAWGTNTAMTVALQTVQRITTTGIYYAAIMVKATTPPTLAGAAALENAVAGGALVTGQTVLAQTSGSALTATAPATIATTTTVTTVPYVIAN
jgi:hypothetical protein